MCPPGCQEEVTRELSRRGLLKILSAAAAAAVAPPALAKSAEKAGGAEALASPGREFDHVVDLTHTLFPDFPTYFGTPQLELDRVAELADDGFNANVWKVHEHTGTHMDAPFHFSDQDSADAIPVAKLVVPLAVVDIRARSAENPDAQVTVEDLKGWERRHGPIPRGACVAMLSGWSDKVGSESFRGADDQGVLHFPGFHVECADFLDERGVNGVAVDTLSLDYGRSPDFAFHVAWLPRNRWGMENVARLDQVPPAGATLIAAGPKIRGASGGPSRVLALFKRKGG